MPDADYLVIESTYGDRLHERENPYDTVARIINEAAKKGGAIVIPSFAVGRAQHMLHIIYELKKAREYQIS